MRGVQCGGVGIVDRLQAGALFSVARMKCAVSIFIQNEMFRGDIETSLRRKSICHHQNGALHPPYLPRHPRAGGDPLFDLAGSDK